MASSDVTAKGQSVIEPIPTQVLNKRVVGVRGRSGNFVVSVLNLPADR
jgi:hypothetical protein